MLVRALTIKLAIDDPYSGRIREPIAHVHPPRGHRWVRGSKSLGASRTQDERYEGEAARQHVPGVEVELLAHGGVLGE